MFKNLYVFSISPSWTMSPEDLEAQLRKQAFSPCGEADASSAGWVHAHGDSGDLLFRTGGYWLIKARFDQKMIPKSAIDDLVDRRVKDLIENHQFSPGKKHLKDMREEATRELTHKALSKSSYVQALIDTNGHFIAVDTSSKSKAEDLLSLLIHSLDKPIPARIARTQSNPSTIMREWMKANELPEPFGLGYHCELRSQSLVDGAIRFVKLNLDTAEVLAHLDNGMSPSSLELTYANLLSFTLTSDFSFKAIKEIEGMSEKLKENNTASDEADFTSTFFVWAAIVSNLITSTTAVLGGLFEPSHPSSASIEG